jgi:hypothetical protein
MIDYIFYFVSVYWHYLLIAAGIVFIAYIAWVLAKSWLRRQVTKDHTCPRCHREKFIHIHRRFYERLLSRDMHLRRYRCANPNCGWEGLRLHH